MVFKIVGKKIGTKIIDKVKPKIVSKTKPKIVSKTKPKIVSKTKPKIVSKTKPKTKTKPKPKRGKRTTTPKTKKTTPTKVEPTFRPPNAKGAKERPDPNQIPKGNRIITSVKPVKPKFTKKEMVVGATVGTGVAAGGGKMAYDLANKGNRRSGKRTTKPSYR